MQEIKQMQDQLKNNIQIQVTSHPYPYIYLYIANFWDFFDEISYIDKGMYSKVYKIKDKENNKQYALKTITEKWCVDNLNLKDNYETYFFKDFILLLNSNHPNLLQYEMACKFHFGDNLSYGIIMEYYPAKPLQDYIKQQKLKGVWNNEYKAPKEDVFVIFNQLIKAIKYLHMTLKIVHRDIKPDNILFDPTSVKTKPNECLKIIDFGMAGYWTSPSYIDSQNPISELIQSASNHLLFSDPKKKCGSPYYAAPELIIVNHLTDNITCEELPLTDIWSMGVTMFYLITGKFPFGHTANNKHELQQDLLNSCLPNYPTFLGRVEKDIISNSLKRDINLRWNINEVENYWNLNSHDFF